MNCYSTHWLLTTVVEWVGQVVLGVVRVVEGGELRVVELPAVPASVAVQKRRQHVKAATDEYVGRSKVYRKQTKEKYRPTY